MDELRVRGATSLWGRMGRTDCGESNNTQYECAIKKINMRLYL